MKIIFDASPMLVNKTGVAYYTERLVTEMAKHHPDVTFVGFYYNFLGRRDSSHLPRAKNLSYTGASIIPSKVVFQLRRWGIEIPVEFLALQRADFILYPNILGYPSLFRTPSAPVVHDLTYLDLPEYVSAKLRSDLVRFVPKQIKRSTFVGTVSEFSKQRISTVYDIPKERIVVTPIPPLPAKAYGQNAVQKKLHKLGVFKPFILFVGTVEPRKNIPNLIDAYAKLPESLRKKYALVLGGGIGWNCDIEIRKLQEAKEQGLDVLHLGYIDDEAKDILYQEADLFVTASHYEGFGMPTLEAMAYGTPCAISDIPIFHEVAGDTAIYFNQDNADDISRTLQELLQDEKKRLALGEQGRARAATYSWTTVANTMYQAIKKSVQTK